MATLSTLQTNVAAEVGLVNTASDDQPQITVALNKAVRDMLRKTHCYIASTTMTLTIGTADYDLETLLGASTLGIDEIYVSSSTAGGRLLERISSGELLALRVPNTIQGTPRCYALMGANKLLVYPTPSAADVFTAYHTPRPTEMSAAGHDPSTATYGGIPVEYHDGLELYAEWKTASLADDGSSAQGARYRDDYRDFIADMKTDVRRKGGKRLPRLTMPTRTRRPTLLSPGQRDV